MSGTITHEAAQNLLTAVQEALRACPDVPATALAAFGRLVDVLETNTDAVVFPADTMLSTEQAAALLGVSRMTVVRLIDRGELATAGDAVHRRIAVSEVARYQNDSRRRRRSAIAELATDITADTPPDEVISTR